MGVKLFYTLVAAVGMIVMVTAVYQVDFVMVLFGFAMLLTGSYEIYLERKD